MFGLFNIFPPLLPREWEEEYNQVKNKWQETLEDFADDINLDFGDAVRGTHKVSNQMCNANRKMRDNIANVAEAVKPLPLKLMDELFEGNTPPAKGDHLFVSRHVYTHHGIYIGSGQVIHYLAKSVSKDSLDTFSDGATIRIKPTYESPARFSPDEIVSRAYSRLGEDSYNVFSNNCEHFARWCRCNAFDDDLI